MVRLVAVDLDGVLVLTPGLHEEALNDALDQVCGFTIAHTEHLEYFNGLPTKTKLDILAQQGRVNPADFKVIFALKQSRTFDLILETVKPNPAIIEIGKYWQSLGLVRVCVTNAMYPSALLMLDQVGILPYIQKIITPDQGIKPKPDPEGYLAAMQYAGASPEETLIIEDSPKGLAAAKATGCSNIWRVNSPDDITVERFRYQYVL